MFAINFVSIIKLLCYFLVKFSFKLTLNVIFALEEQSTSELIIIFN